MECEFSQNQLGILGYRDICMIFLGKRRVKRRIYHMAIVGIRIPPTCSQVAEGGAQVAWGGRSNFRMTMVD